MTERVSFATISPFALCDVERHQDRGRTIDGVGTLFLPQQSAPGKNLPAVIVLQGLGGIIRERELRYCEFLARNGYAALAVDSFEARGAAGLGHTLRALKVTETMMLADAFAALQFLAAHPAIDPARIGVMGFSYGGMITALTAYEQMRRLFSPDGVRFAAHASYYGCLIARLRDVRTTGAPVHLFLGGLDRNVSVPGSQRIADELRQGGSKVEVHVYPDAYHQWDGVDLSRRFTRFSLQSCDLIVEPDNVVRDSRTRLAITGPISRTLMLAANVSVRGYEMLRDEETLAKSDATLLRFFGEALAPGAEVSSPVEGRPVLPTGPASTRTDHKAAARQMS